MIVLSENFRALFYAPFYAAFALGAFRDEGVEVVLRRSPTPAHASADLRAGLADVMWGGPLRVALAHQDDPNCDLVCFCDAVARDPFYVVGHPPADKSPVAVLQDQRFAPVSEVPTPWLCLREDIRRLGGDIGAIKLTLGRTMAQNVTAMRDGTIDAAQLFEPYAEELLYNGDGYMWYAAAHRGLTAYTTLITRRSTLTAKRDELLAMVRAMTTALRWIEDTPGQEVAQALGQYFPLVPDHILAGAIDRYRLVKVYAIDPVIRREGFDWLISAMVAGGALRAPIAFEACVDNTLAKIVAASIEPRTSSRQPPRLGNNGKPRPALRPPVNPRKKVKAPATAKPAH